MEYFYKHCINILFKPFFSDLPEWRNLTGNVFSVILLHNNPTF